MLKKTSNFYAINRVVVLKESIYSYNYLGKKLSDTKIITADTSNNKISKFKNN